jgi:hypothetical protein
MVADVKALTRSVAPEAKEDGEVVHTSGQDG